MNYLRMETSNGNITAVKVTETDVERCAVCDFFGVIERYKNTKLEMLQQKTRHEITAAQYERIKKLTLYKILK